MKNVLYHYMSMRKVDLDDDYIFYEDETIVHHYDKSRYPGGYDLKEEITPNQISDSKKSDILAKCPEDKREAVAKILNS